MLPANTPIASAALLIYYFKRSAATSWDSYAVAMAHTRTRHMNTWAAGAADDLPMNADCGRRARSHLSDRTGSCSSR